MLNMMMRVSLILASKMHLDIKVLGFGSYFREEAFADIDVLLLVNVPECSERRLFKLVRRLRRWAVRAFGVPIDVSIMSFDEFDRRPFLHQDEFKTLFDNTGMI